MKIRNILLIVLFMFCFCEALFAQSEYGKTNIADLVLIYQGGEHRPYKWTKEQFEPYVIHKDQKGKENWLFDGFLFLEFKDGKGYNYAPGYDKQSARKPEWEWLMDKQFEKNKAFSALDQCVEEAKQKIGDPFFRHKLISGIPAPIKAQKDWGNLGHDLDFSNTEDRINACKWYIDRFLERFKNENYKNLDLSGFYWVPENDADYSDILIPIGDYIRSKKLKFYWIPYWKAVGFDNWKTDKFDFAYIQQNHFFKKTISDERLDAVCAFAKGTNMGVELEFDRSALADANDSNYDRLVSYIDAFEKHDVFKEASVAYYQGGTAILDFYKSENPLDKKLMDRLAGIIIKRKKKILRK
jgi:hypothetical protein